MAFVLSASALAFLVRAHDCPDAPVESLYETFIPRSEEHISDGLRWYYCGGLGIALLCMAIITFSHEHKKIPHMRLRKNWRLIFRVFVSIAIILLPLAHLNSLALIGTTTGLVLAVLVAEILGASCVGDSLLWDNKCKRGCTQYDGQCEARKSELQEAVMEGRVVNVEELAKREKEVRGVAATV